MQRDPAQYVSFDTSANDYSCVRRSLDNQLCIREIPDLANSASRVAPSVSLERDSHRAPPLERVTSLSVPPLVPPPQAHHRQDQNCQLSPLGYWLLCTAADDGCALATTGKGVLLSRRGGALTLSLVPTCILFWDCIYYFRV